MINDITRFGGVFIPKLQVSCKSTKYFVSWNKVENFRLVESSELVMSRIMILERHKNACALSECLHGNYAILNHIISANEVVIKHRINFINILSIFLGFPIVFQSHTNYLENWSKDYSNGKIIIQYYLFSYYKRLSNSGFIFS